MRTNLLWSAVVTGLIAGGVNHLNVQACGVVGAPPLQQLAQQAVSENRDVSAMAIRRLRAEGPEGLDALFKAHAGLIQKHQRGVAQPVIEEQPSEWERLKVALDAVGAQHDCYASHLYWYTDFEKAKAAARASGKPILSLRLLGNLDEEYSCANSRFFRTTLYPNAEVSGYLRQHFVLHWQSVRPVPKITIDFGDGRKIQRTITGNSIHYILDSEGEPVDALPGLYGPKAFLRGLAEAEQAALACASYPVAQRRTYLCQYHRQCRATLSRQWEADLAAIGQAAEPVPGEAARLPRAVTAAQAAGELTFSKRAIETPLLKSFQSTSDTQLPPDRAEVSDETWAKIALLHRADAQLDYPAQSLIASKSATAFQASQRAISKRLVENPFLRAWRNLQRSIAEDTVHNEFLLHRQIHDWFVQGVAPADLNGLNRKVYAELFLMPESDPWLGLAPAEAFSGLEANGLVEAAR
jgi:hypothetical protein